MAIPRTNTTEKDNKNMLEITSNKIKKYTISDPKDLIVVLKDLKLDKHLNINNEKFLLQCIEKLGKEKMGILEFRINFSKLLFGCSKFQVKFWKTRGYSEEESLKLSKEFASDGASKVHNSRTAEERKQVAAEAGKKRAEQIKEFKKSNPIKLKEQTNTAIEYYLIRGMNREEAEQALKERQSTFSKKKMIEKHGEEEGLKKLEERNTKWFKTLKENNNWEELSRKKTVNFCKASKESLLVFLPLLNEFQQKFKCYLGYENLNEWTIFDNDLERCCFYDFTLREPKIIIEFHGESFHPNKKKLTKEEWNNWKNPFSNISVNEAYIKDQYKRKLAEENGFKVLELWSSTPVSENIELARKFILENS